ncbi:hypothetical protein K491DRAFT_778003 [Lophiostoma macrostomum CBS 122681]|uniref:F-box domain-containing protein n=1 Tax=Lophiostoma macrostomum CBS 122681 TaxID=1314788 RepID=A0A6A6T958_9PLEO|nr:hypothetical protein K491DRAFT_778003 [Lophiostoma macrostomum CBS 122681]
MAHLSVIYCVVVGLALGSLLVVLRPKHRLETQNHTDEDQTYSPNHEAARGTVLIRRQVLRKQTPIPTTVGSTQDEILKDGPSPERSTFFVLPLEIRDQIYEIVMEDLPTRLSINNSTTINHKVLLPKVLPSICFASKQLHQEVVLAYIRRTRFELHHPTSEMLRLLRDFLGSFEDNRGFEAIRMLSFYDGSSMAGINEFVKDLPGLRSVILGMEADDFITGDEPSADSHDDDFSGDFRSITESEIEEYYQLKSFLEVVSTNKVRHMEFSCRGVDRSSHVVTDPGCPFHRVLDEGIKNSPANFTLVLNYAFGDDFGRIHTRYSQLKTAPKKV